MNSHNIAISRFGMRCETCFMPLGKDFGCHYPECSDPCPPRDAVDSLNKLSGGPNPPAPHDWQKRFLDAESQLTDLREKLRVAEETNSDLRKIADLARTIMEPVQRRNFDKAIEHLPEPASNPIAERAVRYFEVLERQCDEWAEKEYEQGRPHGKWAFEYVALKIRDILSQLQEREQ